MGHAGAAFGKREDISGAQGVAGAADLPPLAGLLYAGPRQRDAGRAVGVLDQAGTIKAFAVGALTAVFVRPPDLLLRNAHDIQDQRVGVGPFHRLSRLRRRDARRAHAGCRAVGCDPGGGRRVQGSRPPAAEIRAQPDRQFRAITMARHQRSPPPFDPERKWPCRREFESHSRRPRVPLWVRAGKPQPAANAAYSVKAGVAAPEQGRIQPQPYSPLMGAGTGEGQAAKVRGQRSRRGLQGQLV